MFDWGIGQLSTEALVAELKARFDHCLVFLLREETKEDEGTSVQCVNGDHYTLLGMSVELQSLVQKEADDDDCQGK